MINYYILSLNQTASGMQCRWYSDTGDLMDTQLKGGLYDICR
jgi:hypothetical protein